MKILLVRPWPYKLNIDSYNVQEIGLSRALVKRGHTCGIVLYLEEGESYTEEYEQGITIYYLRGRNFFKNGLFGKELNSIIERYDVIQVHEYDQIQSWKIYSHIHDKKVVIYHGPYYDKFNRGYNLKCSVFDSMFLSFSQKAKKEVTCLTKSPLAADFLKSKGFKNVISVGVGLDTKPFEGDGVDDISDQMPGDKVNIIYVGKLEERRNTPFLFDLMLLILNSVPDAFCTVVGSGDREYVEALQDKIRTLKDTGRFLYIEKAPQKALAQTYKKADIMLFPSNYEIFGMVLLEAMFFENAVISSVNGGSSELISDGENGIICNSFSTDEWLDKVTELVKDKDKLYSIKANASKTIHDSYTWDSIAEKFERAYRLESK
ncbi:glycosyltransferase family 4 protein [Butyrivibrio sp. TB]|uniref:glycosyltransferase family 4 protein n=1 Tax=Butyrivibrio sp. TB TaxID=1520809 RepID=UPI0008B1BBEC|nr:glycosyltransferase family 4 protein [Butyrivibrio sp. TB]SEQ36553.1 Glycosyltransferase involved in cell wall bisynthesis [Butyrivibrio sp. TB]